MIWYKKLVWHFLAIKAKSILVIYIQYCYIDQYYKFTYYSQVSNKEHFVVHYNLYGDRGNFLVYYTNE